jgi:hypothetical protein
MAYGREKRGSDERAQMAAVLPFLESLASRGQLTNSPPPFRMAALPLMGSATKLCH